MSMNHGGGRREGEMQDLQSHIFGANINKPIFTTYLNNTCTWEGGNAEMSMKGGIMERGR